MPARGNQPTCAPANGDKASATSSWTFMAAVHPRSRRGEPHGPRLRNDRAAGGGSTRSPTHRCTPMSALAQPAHLGTAEAQPRWCITHGGFRETAEESKKAGRQEGRFSGEARTPERYRWDQTRPLLHFKAVQERSVACRRPRVAFRPSTRISLGVNLALGFDPQWRPRFVSRVTCFAVLEGRYFATGGPTSRRSPHAHRLSRSHRGGSRSRPARSPG